MKFKKFRRIANYIWILLAVVWIVTFIFFKYTPYPILASGILMGDTIWVTIFNCVNPKYDGALQYDSDVNENTEKWNLVVNGDPSEWPMLDEILLKVEKRKDDI
jgi:hypothetical protein